MFSFRKAKKDKTPAQSAEETLKNKAEREKEISELEDKIKFLYENRNELEIIATFYTEESHSAELKTDRNSLFAHEQKLEKEKLPNAPGGSKSPQSKT